MSASKPGILQILQIIQDLSKKNPEQAFVYIVKQKTCPKFQQKILNSKVVAAHQNFKFSKDKKMLNSMVVAARENFEFSRQKKLVSRKAIELCLNFSMGFCIN